MSMKLPDRVNDPSLLQDEPLCNFITIAEIANSRSREKDAVSGFVKAMQETPGPDAALVVKSWAHLLFGHSLLDGHSPQITNGGEKLYEAFFEYQRRLYRDLQSAGKTEEANRYQVQLVGNGMAALGLKLKSRCLPVAPQRAQAGKGKKGRKPREATSVEESPGDTLMEGDAQPTVDNPESPVIYCKADEPPAALPTDAKQSERSTSKSRKKRKASSQKPAVISPSDASEDDAPPSSALSAPPEPDSTALSHPQKQIAPKPRRIRILLEGKNQVGVKNSSRPSRKDKRLGEYSGSCELNSPRKHSRPGNITTVHKPEGGRGAPLAQLAHARRKHDINKVTNVPTRVTQASSHLGGVRKAKLANKTSQFRAPKRIRRGSMSILAVDIRGGSEVIPNVQRNDLHGFPLQPCKTIRPPSALENAHKIQRLRRKRTRLEYEGEFVASDVNISNDAWQEPLGTDAREIRPLPQKLCTKRSPRAVGTNLGIPEIPSWTQSLENADRLLRDSATNAVAVLQATKIDLDEPDWTQGNEPDADCDGLDGQGEGNDMPVDAPDPSPSGLGSKPPLQALPRIWAQSRQEVCESFEYFRSYHGGVYSKNDIVNGYLLGAFSASRDLFHHGGRLIISHGGGKSESIYDTRMGPRKYLTDQDQEATDRSVRALLKTHREQRALTLLADDKYALFPYDLAGSNYTYVVLGLYWISHAWAECQLTRDGSRRVVRWKFAFQWCEGQGDPWWIPQHGIKEAVNDQPTRSPSTRDSSQPPGNLSHRCEQCQGESPTVYRQGWMCLTPRCSEFWSIIGKDPQELDYAEEFLNLISKDFANLPDIRPTKAIEMSSGVTTTYACSKGWHCTNCGRLSCRYKWEHWECSNCQVQSVVKGRLRSPKEFWHQRPSREFLHSHVGKDSGIIACRLEPVDLGAPKGFTNRLSFILPHGRGKIHLILGTPLANGDADDIFQMYQEQASTGELKLRRYPLRNHRARGALLTNYFSQNSGEPYQYVGGTGNTVPFHEAPDCVRRALALIKERAGLALRSEIPFNEVLSAAYMERQKMSFHSDSEKGLGPNVASLSLGSAALMHFRQHANVENLERPRSYALTLALRHGDVLIMEGDGVQKCYEHTVVPLNFRVAATARCIGST